jgi:hypothetical protein
MNLRFLQILLNFSINIVSKTQIIFFRNGLELY